MKQILLASLLAASCLACEKDDATPEPLQPNSSNNRSVGASAAELLSSGKYTSLKVEIQYMPGFAPDAGAISHLQDFLSTYLNKPGGISIVTKEISATSSTTLSADDIHTIEKANRTVFTTGAQIGVYVLYTNGSYSETNVLGVAYRNTSAALMGKTIRDNSGGIGQANRTKLEATVLEHEMAHLLGLVEVGTAMQSPHKANGNHCNNQNCLMYFASETTDVLGFLVTGNIPSLDAACVADLKANGGK